MHGDIIVAKIAAVYNYSIDIEEFEHATIRTYTKFVLYFVNYLSQAATWAQKRHLSPFILRVLSSFSSI